MQIDFLTVLIAVVSLLILGIPGFLLAKFKMLPKGTVEGLSTLILYGFQPALIFMSFQEYYRDDIASNILIVAGLTALLHAVILAIIYLCIRNKERDAKKNTARYASVFSNCGFMGIPFLQVIFGGSSIGNEIIIYSAVVIAVFNLFNWTVGVYIYSGDKKDISFKKIILNPTIVSIILGVLYFFIAKQPIQTFAQEGTQLRMVLEKIMSSVAVIGNLVSPLALTVIGIRLANIKLKDLLFDKWAYIVCFLKLIVLSFITILVVAYLPISTIVKYVMFFLLSMPSATSTVMFAVKFGGDGDAATVFVLLTTIMTILTIPLMFLLMSGVFVPL